MIQGNLKLGDGQRIYLVGQVVPRDFIPHIRQEDYMNDRVDTQYLQHRGTRSLIRQRHPDLTQWLKQHQARTTCWVDPLVFHGSPLRAMPVSYGLGFAPDQTALETLFVLKWS